MAILNVLDCDSVSRCRLKARKVGCVDLNGLVCQSFLVGLVSFANPLDHTEDWVDACHDDPAAHHVVGESGASCNGIASEARVANQRAVGVDVHGPLRPCVCERRGGKDCERYQSAK